MASQNYRNTVQEWEEKLLQCPYIPSHQIRPARLGHHLIQCRKALSKQPTSPYFHKIDDLVVCKFNSHHHIPREKMKDHIQKCQGSVTVLKELSSKPLKKEAVDDGISSITSGISKISAKSYDDDDWEEEAHPAYDPNVKAANLPMHMPAGLTPAERRNYRQAKRTGDVFYSNKDEDDWDEEAVPVARGPPPGFNPSNASRGRGRGRGGNKVRT